MPRYTTQPKPTPDGASDIKPAIKPDVAGLNNREIVKAEFVGAGFVGVVHHHGQRTHWPHRRADCQRWPVRGGYAAVSGFPPMSCAVFALLGLFSPVCVFSRQTNIRQTQPNPYKPLCLLSVADLDTCLHTVMWEISESANKPIAIKTCAVRQKSDCAIRCAIGSLTQR